MKSITKKVICSLLGVILSFSLVAVSVYASDIEDYIIVVDGNGIETKVYSLSEEDHIAFRNSVEKELTIQPFLSVKGYYKLDRNTYTFICSDNNWLNASVRLFYCYQGDDAPKNIGTYMSSEGNTYGPYTMWEGGSAYFPKIQWNSGTYTIYAKSIDKNGTGLIQVWD